LALDVGKFPRFATLGSIVGKSSKRAAEDYGLPYETPIVAGGPDFVMAMLGTATIETGLAFDRAGSSEGINVCFKEKEGEKSIIPSHLTRQMRILPHAVPSLTNISSLIPESGSLYQRYREETGLAHTDYDVSLEQDLSDPQRRGFKVLEGIALRVKQALLNLAALGFPVHDLTVSGGQAKNARWNQFKADVSGCVFKIPRIRDGELAGDAATAAFALGQADSLAQASTRIVKIARVFYPTGRQNHAL
jgi:sugar (pentulose or hexulose) kinase